MQIVQLKRVCLFTRLIKKRIKKTSIITASATNLAVFNFNWFFFYPEMKLYYILYNQSVHTYTQPIP